MAEPNAWAFPASLQPSPDEAKFDLDSALDSVVLLRAEIPEDAFTAPILGTARAGNGIVIREDGLVVTIGYLITEAESIWLTTNRGTVMWRRTPPPARDPGRLAAPSGPGGAARGSTRRWQGCPARTRRG